MKLKKPKQWVNFEKDAERSDKKTSRWFVFSLDMYWLGEIKWFGRHRGYNFFPAKETTFSPSCLVQIAEFATMATVAHNIMRIAAKREK